jgi:hypothetical protein
MKRTWFFIVNSTLFAAAMGWLEGVVVVYLRTILLRRPDWKTIEITREAATLIMLIAFAAAAGRNRRERVGAFLWVFGLWDIIYYVSLWTWLKWPESLATMDTLFYIPCVWQSPVYVPVFFALLMMLIGLLLWLNRLTNHLAAGGRWGLAGWVAGLLAGLAIAGIRGLPLSVSAMGISVCLGLTAAGVGMGRQIGRGADSLSFLTMAGMAACGALGGMLGHLARSMFYTSPHSFLWPAALGFTAGILLFFRRRASTSLKNPVPN